MLELLSLLLGGGLRLLPEVIGLFKARGERDHEYRMTQLQLDIDKARAQQALDLAHQQGQIASDKAEMDALIAAVTAQGQPTGNPRLDAINMSVRPILTYWWCLVLYTAAKAVSIYVALEAELPLAQMAPILVTEFDRSVIGSIFAFWFVDRSLRKLGRAA